MGRVFLLLSISFWSYRQGLHSVIWSECLMVGNGGAPRVRSGKTVAPTVGVAILQLFVSVGVFFMLFVDIVGLSGCEDCDPSIGASARVLVFAPMALAWAATGAGVIVGHFMDRSPAWVPAVGSVVIVAAYLIARHLIYSAT
jgi:hypothetical protein